MLDRPVLMTGGLRTMPGHYRRRLLVRGTANGTQPPNGRRRSTSGSAPTTSNSNLQQSRIASNSVGPPSGPPQTPLDPPNKPARFAHLGINMPRPATANSSMPDQVHTGRAATPAAQSDAVSTNGHHAGPGRLTPPVPVSNPDAQQPAPGGSTAGWAQSRPPAVPISNLNEAEEEEGYEEFEEEESAGTAALFDASMQSTAAMTDAERAELLADMLEDAEVILDAGVPPPGQYNGLRCPFCRGGDSCECSFSLNIQERYNGAAWKCHRERKCGVQGGVQIPTLVVPKKGAASTQALTPPTPTTDATSASPAWGAGGAVANGSQPMERTRVRVSAAQQELYSSQLEKQLSSLKPLTEAQLAWLVDERKIDPAVLELNGIMCAPRAYYDKVLEEKADAIVFPYYNNKRIVNMKYRALPKQFWQTRGGEKVMYGMDVVRERGMVGDPPTLPWLIIVEGEMDVLALQTAGFYNVVSVPEGGVPPAKAGSPTGRRFGGDGHDGKFSFLTNCSELLEAAERIVIATDNDGPGKALAEELARRLGKERCWRVMWPNNRQELLRDDIIQAKVEQDQAPGWEVGSDQPSAAASADLMGSIMRATHELRGDADRLRLLTSRPAGDGPAGGTMEGPAASGAVESREQPVPLGTAPSPPLAEDDTGFRKDANEVLMKDGKDVLIRCMESREEWPVEGLFRFSQYYDDIKSYYDEVNPDNTGVSTGWPSLDECYKVIPGELTVVTGVPNSGKSEWLDSLAANLAHQYDWRFAFCSMEKTVKDHARQLLEKKVGKPFFLMAYANGQKRAEWDDILNEFDWVDDHFFLIRREDDALPNIDWVIEMAKTAVVRYGIRGLIIDPYNELDHQRGEMKETEYVSQMLTKVKRFAQHYEVHVWFVAHPRQMRDWKGEPPNLYDISGSAHFINKADNGIVVHRQWPTDEKKEGGPGRPAAAQEKVNPGEVRILVRKVRNKAAGKVGDCALQYERTCGRYSDPVGQGDLWMKRSAGPKNQVMDWLAGGGVRLVDKDPPGGEVAPGEAYAAAGLTAALSASPSHSVPAGSVVGHFSQAGAGGQNGQYPSPLVNMGLYGVAAAAEHGSAGMAAEDGDEEGEMEEYELGDHGEFKREVHNAR